MGDPLERGRGHGYWKCSSTPFPKMSQRSKEISVAAIYFFREQAEHGYDDADVDMAKSELEALLKDA